MRRILLALLLLAAPARAETQLRIGIGSDPAVLDPAQSGAFVERIVFAALCDKLVDIGPDLGFRPELATAWAWSADGLALTLTLRPDGRFHDGTPVDAAAVAANLERYRNGRESRRRSELRPVSAVETPDARTVVIRLSEPFAPLLSVLSDRAGMMLSPAALARDGARIGEAPVCSGPFHFARRVIQDRIELTRFAEHWNAAAILVDRVVFQPIPDSTVRLLNLRAGQLDIAVALAPSDVADVQRDRRLRLVEATSIAYQTLALNTGRGPLADARVREALERSIDRGIINHVALEGRFIPNNQPEAPGTPFHFADRPAPPRDPARARALLREAGLSRVAFTLKTTNSPVEAQVAQIIQSMAAEGGFDVRLEVLEASAMVAATQRGDFDAAIAIWSGRADPDGNIAIWLACDGFLNWAKYCSPPLDAALAAGRMATDPARRRPHYAAAAAIWMAERPHLILYHHRWFWGLRAGVEGFTPSPDGIIRFAGLRPAR
jgi:peptide/nickel transport system substrate-binding protein